MKVTLHNAQQGYQAFAGLWSNTIKPALMAGHKVEVTADYETRTTDQNSAQWPILQAFSDQLVWPVNGQMTRLTADEWKDILTAAYRQEVPRLAQGLNGGVVMLGQRTSKFKRNEWGAWMEFLNAVASDRGVKVPLPKSMEGAYA
jgi:hypothetical protein